MHRRWPLALIFAAPLLIAALIVLPGSPPSASTPADWFTPDETVIEECPPGAVSCIRQALSNIAYRDGGRAALDAMEERFVSDPVFFNDCHGTAHAIGGAVFTRTLDIENSMLEGGSTCGYGFYHGVVERAFTISGINPAEAGEVCASFELPHDRDQCSHGAGHAFGSIGAPAEAAERCLIFSETAGTGTAGSSCFSGAFMEGFSGALGPPRWKDGMRSCDAIDSRVRPECYGGAAIARLQEAPENISPHEYAHLGCADLAGRDLEGCVIGWTSQIPGRTGWKALCQIAGDLAPLCAENVGEMEAVFRMPTPWIAAGSCEQEFDGDNTLLLACAKGAGRRLSLAECELFRRPEALFTCRASHEGLVR